MACIKRKPTLNPLTRMQFPIYCVESWDDRFVYLGGGGGMEIQNVIQVYPLTSSTIFKKEDLIEEVKTDKAVPCFMHASLDVNLMAACLREDVVLYKIN
jgi:hypothetical protein